MSELSQKPGGMDIETTFECQHCGKELPVTNQLTHEVACARMHRDSQRAQPNVRQSSSGAIPEGVIQQREQPIPRREERQIAENKLITCPNCEKSVREQDINSHMDNECLKSEMIPCEFCDKAIPMSNYSQHIDGCPKRAENHRDQAPIRERREPGGPSQQQQRQGPTGRDRSPRRGSSLGGGGVPGLLMNLAGLNPENQQQQQYPQYQQQQQQFQQFQQPQRQQQQGGFFSNIFGQPQPQVPRNLGNDPSSQGQRVFRTVEYGPDGSVVVRSQILPTSNNNNQFQMFQQSQMSRPMEFDPLGMLFNMMSGRGLIPMGNGEFELGPPEEGRGLDKGTINSLAVIKYNKEANKNVSEDLKRCPICLDDFQDGQEVRFLWCTHRFHKGCVDQWLDKHTTCPICKKDFSEAEYGFSP